MKKGILFWPLALSLTACSSAVQDLYTSEPDTTSGDVGPFLETSNIELTASSFFGSSKDGMLIVLKRGDTKNNLRVGSKDNLLIAVYGVPQLIEEVKNAHCTGGLGACSYSYYYRINFQDNPDGQPLTISLQRTTGVSSQTTLTLPPRPTITAPISSAVIDLSADTMNISWQPGMAEETQLILPGDCGVYANLRFTDSRTTHSFAPGTFQFSTAREFCVNATELPLPLQITRYQDYSADSALAPSSMLQLSITAEVVVQVRP